MAGVCVCIQQNFQSKNLNSFISRNCRWESSLHIWQNLPSLFWYLSLFSIFYKSWKRLRYFKLWHNVSMHTNTYIHAHVYTHKHTHTRTNTRVHNTVSMNSCLTFPIDRFLLMAYNAYDFEEGTYPRNCIHGCQPLDNFPCQMNEKKRSNKTVCYTLFLLHGHS